MVCSTAIADSYTRGPIREKDQKQKSWYSVGEGTKPALTAHAPSLSIITSLMSNQHLQMLCRGLNPTEGRGSPERHGGPAEPHRKPEMHVLPGVLESSGAWTDFCPERVMCTEDQSPGKVSREDRGRSVVETGELERALQGTLRRPQRSGPAPLMWLREHWSGSHSSSLLLSRDFHKGTP